ncbi:MAG: DUF6125 family protein [Bacillota bacterium]
MGETFRGPAPLQSSEVILALADAAKLWLAHDGLWFQAVERAYGLEAAIALDKEAMARFSAIEAKRIVARLGLGEAAGLEGLALSLRHRLYAQLNDQEVTLEADRVVLRMLTCRVQAARERQGLVAFPCREVGAVEYAEFARGVDERLKVTCLSCPPGPRDARGWCAWEFRLD